MNKQAQLALEQAIYNAIADDVSTKVDGSLRNVCDKEFVDLYYETGAKTRDIMHDGEKIGTYSLVFNKGTDSSIHHEFVVQNRDRLSQAIDEMSEEELRFYAHALKEEIARYAFDDSGELLPGCILESVYVPGTDATIKGTALKLESKFKDRVKLALMEQTPRALLGGGE